MNLKLIRENCKEIDFKFSQITCCFTGHRPQKLPWGFNEEDERCLNVKKDAKNYILSAINNGYKYFISGMALGFDMICAEIILELKKQYKDIKLICAIPCKNQCEKWSKKDQKRYKTILKKASIVRCIFDIYNEKCMQERNKFMINNSSLCIALFSGKPGGTKQTIEYAKQNGLQMQIILV